MKNFNGIWISKDVFYVVIAGWGIIAIIILVIVFWPKRAAPIKQQQASKQVPARRESPQPQTNPVKRKRGGFQKSSRKK